MKNRRGQQEEPATGNDLEVSLELRRVELSEGPIGPGVWDLRVGLSEFVLLEGLSPVEADALLSCAASLRPPAAGQVRHWGLDLGVLSREELFHWRRRIGFVGASPVLLERLTVRDNLSLAQLYHEGRSAAATPDREDLEAELRVSPYLDRYPRELPLEVYHLAVWARELLKGPRLILWALAPPDLSAAGYGILLPILSRFQRQRRTAVVIAGTRLVMAYPWAERLLRLSRDSFATHALPGLEARPLTTYLPVL